MATCIAMKTKLHRSLPLLTLLAGGALSLLLLPGCAHLYGPSESRRATSLMNYLYPGDRNHTEKPAIPTLTLPLRVGVAFVPGSQETGRHFAAVEDRLPEPFKAGLIAKVADHFRDLPFVRDIELIPTAYLQPGGGFENLDRLRQMFGVDVVALLSFDQAQSTDNDFWAITYWTVVGAYVVPAEKNLTTTLLDAAVFDIPSRKLLFRAPGTSRLPHGSTVINRSEALRKDAQAGFQMASTNLVANLRTELAAFQERVKERPDDVKIVRSPGYRAGAGSFGPAEVVSLAVVAVLLRWRRSGSSDR